jgi:hypothetical protein
MIELGLLLGHSYGVIEVFELDNNGETLQLLKIRNPWGQH